MQAGDQSITLGRQQVRVRSGRRIGAYILYMGIVTVLLVSNALTALALYFAPEVSALMRDDNSALLAAYEQRITELRLEVDRLHSRQYAQMGDMNLQMHELVQQQEVLSEQHEYVRALTEMAREMGIAQAPAATADVTAPTPPLSGDTAALAESLIAMQEDTRMALVSLSDAATLSANDILTRLRSVGIEPELAAEGVGGPFIPAQGEGLSIIDEANAVADALARYQSARHALLKAPVQTPISGTGTVTSNFGNRTDPFLKRAAFHAGIDFRASTGTPVLAAASGTVKFAGGNGGYGNMVEIDHGNGYATRYAHLSQIAVAIGQTVTGGQRIGLAGSTGRSTGPHLHFEVRRSGSAIDPTRFIAAGRALAAYL
ncbi:M23 family metallopeptidase [Pelagibacterium sp. H642]|uniref:M23 family metallopeptidase n=1 Tax=Pelagibacterium sp. H642 TaxID=1881069 RepID=UPI0028159059|nr:M23 family metallopeptidase [Pelagibacterium sp. H642]